MRAYAISAIAVAIFLAATPADAQGKLYLGAYPAIPETPLPYRDRKPPRDTSESRILHFERSNTILTHSVLVDFASWSNMYQFMKAWNERTDKRNEHHGKMLEAILEELKEINRRSRSDR